MSQLLDAIAGVPNACEPLPGMVTGGQPALDHLENLKRAGCEVVLDVREPMEPRPFETPAAVQAAGFEYVGIPVGHGTISDETFARIRDAVRGLVGRRPVFFHCGSGNRVGVTLIPYFVLDLGMDEEAALQLAMQIGTRSGGLVEQALDYVRRQRT